MNDMSLDFEANMGNLDDDAWYARLEELSDELGYFQPLNDDHVAVLLDAGPNLLVTFENAAQIRKDSPNAEPHGFRFVKNEGWTHLAIISREESWFRDVSIYRYFDRLIDDGFFEDFDNVLFYGVNGGGYAATAYCAASPGCNVLAIRPQATLDPRITGWDTRYTAQRRLNFSDRFGYGPDMIDAANHAYIAFDPLQRWDACHAGMFTKSNMTPLRCFGASARVEMLLGRLDILDGLIRDAMDKTLDAAKFAKAYRARRENILYLVNLFKRMIQTDHPKLAANVCAYALRNHDNQFFKTKLAELMDAGHMPSTPVEIDAA